MIPPKTRQIITPGAGDTGWPLALNANRKLDERRQPRCTGITPPLGLVELRVGRFTRHSSRFAIRRLGCSTPVLSLARRR